MALILRVMSPTAYASVNGLQMYYEVHGSGSPLVLLHGGALTIGLSFGAMIPALAETHRVIAVEMQGHGHTADIDREMTPATFADDIVTLLGQLGIEQADLFGYSLGGCVSLEIATRHPRLVRKPVLASTVSDAGSGQRVDPALESTRFAGDQRWIAECVRDQRDALIGREQTYRQVAGVGSPGLTELSLGPVDWNHQRRPCAADELVVALIEL